MRPINLSGIIFLLLLVLTGCSSSNDPANDDIIVYEEGDIQVLLIDVNDYRCPVNVVCLWEGNAEVSLRLNHGNETEDFILHTLGYDEYPDHATVLSLEIELLEVLPLPFEGMTYDLEDYTVNIHVTD